MEKSYSPKKFRRKIPKVGRSYEQYQNEKQSFDKSKDINDLIEELMLQKACDKIPGGLADDMEPDDFDQEELNAGIKVEMEHTSDKNIAREIAMDHLTEDPNYYKKLKKIHKSEVIMNDKFNINDFVEEELVKAKKLPEGTTRTYNGRDYIKQGGERIPIKKVAGATQKQESPAKKEDNSIKKEYSMLNKLLDKKISKSQELIMDIDKEIEQNAELMEKAFSAQIENTKKIIKSLSKEELQNVVSSLNVEQKQLFKSILEDMTKAIEMDKFYSGTKKKVELKNAVAGVDTGSDEDDEKLVLSEAAAHNHQGDATPEGFEGQIIKAEACMKGQKEDKAKKKLVEAVDEVAEGEAKEAKEEHEEEMHKKDIKKSIEWKSENELLKANTLGRNHHFSVNEYYNQVLMPTKTEEMIKANAPEDTSINGLLESGKDQSINDVLNKSVEIDKSKFNTISFSDLDLAAALGMDEEEFKKLIG